MTILMLALGCSAGHGDSDGGTVSPVPVSIGSEDADGDGWSAQDGDCDDGDPGIGPAEPEMGGNDVDENCDGTLITTVLSVSEAALASFRGEVTDRDGAQCTGDGVAFLRDVTGDGVTDIAIGASGCVYSDLPGEGRAYILPGPLTGETNPLDAIARIRSTSALVSGLGGQVLGDLGDLDGDGWPEMYYHAQWADYPNGRLDIFSAPISGDVMDSDADTSIRHDGKSSGHFALGSGVTDIDGATWAMTAWSEESGSANIYIIEGLPVTGSPETVASYTIWGEVSDGGARLAQGDLDADGIADLAFGSFVTLGNGESGLVAAVPGPVTTDAVLADVGSMWLGGSKHEHVGESLAVPGDTNGDGFEDLLVGAFFNSDVNYAGGVAYLILGASVEFEIRSILDADLRIQSENSQDSLGDSVSGLGDLDGDGLPELGLTASRSSGSAEAFPPARVYLIRSPPPSGTISAGELDGALIGSAQEEIVSFPYGSGTLLAGGADMDGDGVPEFLVGSPLVDGGYYDDVGRVDLIEGWPF